MVAQNQTEQIQAWAHYLTTEEGLSPATVKEYLKDLRLLRAWLDRSELPESPARTRLDPDRCCRPARLPGPQQTRAPPQPPPGLVLAQFLGVPPGHSACT